AHMCRNNVRPSTVSSSVASQPEWKRESVAPKTGNPLKKIPRVNDTTVTWSCISNVMDPMTTEQVDSASEDTSVYLGQNGCTSKVRSKSYISSPRPTKELEWSGKSGKMTLKHRCTICLKTFCSPSKLQRHSLIHTGQKPHSCTMCLKRFPSTSKLQRHMLTHTGQRPFGCEVCGKRFRQKTHLRVHFLCILLLHTDK
uniref:C2H2-type domain-containing protein n=1 Tax=Gasterosteus aculeatus aculeatus TaxID=481459 RepID=A0AAQ4RM44_GASAC